MIWFIFLQDSSGYYMKNRFSKAGMDVESSYPAVATNQSVIQVGDEAIWVKEVVLEMKE